MRWPHTKTNFAKWMEENRPILWEQFQSCRLEWNDTTHKQRSRIITMSLLGMAFFGSFFFEGFGAGMVAGAMLAFLLLVYFSFADLERLKKERIENP